MNLQKLLGEPGLTDKEARSELAKKIAIFGAGVGLLGAITYAQIATGCINTPDEEIACGILKALVGGLDISYLTSPKYSQNGAWFFG